ncbi:hypothetical protein CLPUN_42000 [Clostridium puniceum]|uniref:Uncharacterized protein n=1 Tax=Clostridium puniceum TaxID=29367 RepID=A0A1S8T8I0_9CLOT|nr:hypothetical protein [Clostridium puniceum]OOM73962.1 hypothetical protein CLPUN_42000 [Clostridium puniceum]
MLENATVTMPYKELEELLEELKSLKEKIKNIPMEMDEDEFETDPFKNALDTIFDLLEEASKLVDSNEKQYFIYEGMKTYCKTFEMDEKELLEDVPKGSKSK